MYVEIVALRKAGKKLSRSQLDGPYRYVLTIESTWSMAEGRKIWSATAYARAMYSRGAPSFLPDLHQARIRLCNEHGMILVGLERAEAAEYPQAWWVKPVPMPPPLPDGRQVRPGIDKSTWNLPRADLINPRPAAPAEPSAGGE